MAPAPRRGTAQPYGIWVPYGNRITVKLGQAHRRRTLPLRGSLPMSLAPSWLSLPTTHEPACCLSLSSLYLCTVWLGLAWFWCWPAGWTHILWLLRWSVSCLLHLLSSGSAVSVSNLSSLTLNPWLLCWKDAVLDSMGPISLPLQEYLPHGRIHKLLALTTSLLGRCCALETFLM